MPPGTGLTPAPKAIAGPVTLSYAIGGLDKPAEILVDQWGVPHIYAQSQYDAFFVQGFNAARDRLWQIDLWQRRGLGTLAEVFGPTLVRRDEAARLFLYRGDMYREWLAYGSDAKRIAESFTAGINAYVRLIEQKPDLLPVEFAKLGYRPSLWKAEDVVRIRAHGLWRNVNSEVRRAQVACVAGLKADLTRRWLEPPHATQVPEGLDPCDIRAEILALYTLATGSVTFSKDVIKAAQTGDRDGIATAILASAQQADSTRAADSEGSNNWVIAGKLTTTGRPLLANDPHRAHSLPSLRYIAHLNAPGLNMIGAGEPALPGLSIGHNDRIAFGLTIFYIDQEDLYVEELNPGNPDEVKWQSRYEPIRTIDETIAVRGAPPVRVALQFTRHGPVIFTDHAKNKAYAVRAAWLEPGMAPYFGSVETMRAQNWDQFVAAMNRWGAPSENQVYADVDGNIGWKPGGLAPIRPHHDGLLPVPGDGRYEWSGYYDMDQLPIEANPERGWIATANQMNIPANNRVPAGQLGMEWVPAWRFERIKEMLERPEKKSLQDMVTLQTDYLSVPARRLVLLLKDTQTQDSRVAEAISMLRNWDFRLTADSPVAALFQVWVDRHLGPAVVRLRTSPEAVKLIGDIDSNALFAALEQPAGRPQRDQLFAGTLRAAIAEMEQRQGPNWQQWSWGKLHTIEFNHPLASVLDPVTAKRLHLAARPRGGGNFTVNANTYPTGTMRVTAGASFRMAIDVGSWDNALAFNVPGQSGDPNSAHYSDLFDLWAKDTAFPLLYSRAAIEKATEMKILLTPAK
ncbi:MAG: penicillin acylase family protein [Betaproteobacteria bacterium]